MSLEASLLRIAEVTVPAGRWVEAPNENLVRRALELVASISPGALEAYTWVVRSLNVAAIAFAGRPLSMLPREERLVALQKLQHSTATTQWMTRAVVAPLKLLQADANAVQAHIGYSRQCETLGAERNRFEERIVDARKLDPDETFEVDAVIVGSGAGGAPLALRLAQQGHAVIIVEEGSYFTREDFQSPAIELQQRMYHNMGATLALGNCVIPIPTGRTVGGSTTINSGTCYRADNDVFVRWELEHGLAMFKHGALDSYYDKVEKMLEVTAADPRYLGGSAALIAKGAESLGLKHLPLMRNAPGCDGQGLCCFGCPTDAKRSTNVSYIPNALEAGAMLLSNASLKRVIVEKGIAVGVIAHSTTESGELRRIEIRAKTVTLACGSLRTPLMLLRQGLISRSEQVGKNLSIHPASYAWAEFDHRVEGWKGIPQGYAVEEFRAQGITFEGVSLPPSVALTTNNAVGSQWTHLAENYDRIASFGFMIRDSSRGTVRLGPSGQPVVTYSLTAEDRQRLVMGQSWLAKIFHAAGALRVFPGAKWEPLETRADIDRFEQQACERLSPHHYEVSAFHPLGTCRMGTDGSRSVVGHSHEAHDLPGLFIVDGSVVSGPLGVNPQMTIMALSERAASFVGERIDKNHGARSQRDNKITFAETLQGTLVDIATGIERRARIDVAAATASDLRGQSCEGIFHSDLTCSVDIEGIATGQGATGRLTIRPGVQQGTFKYEVLFVDVDKRPLRLQGSKHVHPLRLLATMTTLHAELIDQAGLLLAKGTLRFPLQTLLPWLQSFKLTESAP